MTLGTFIKTGFIFLIGMISVSLQESQHDDDVSLDTCQLWNAALCKPSFSINVKADNPPELSVDGNRNPVLGGGSCAHTNYDLNSWWMVDLMDEYLVHQIVVTNRNDNFEWRFQVVDMDLFLTDPRLDSDFPMNTNGTRCRRVSKYPIVTTTYDCITPTYARFVKLVRIHRRDHFTLCELEVMVSKKRGDPACRRTVSKPFDITRNYTMVENGHIVLNTTADTAMMCTYLCAEKGHLCNGFYWSEGTRDCQMLQVNPYESQQLVYNEGTDLYMEIPTQCMGVGKWKYV